MSTRDEGDHAFYDERVLCHYGDLKRLICAISGDTELAIDIVQGTMERAWRRLDRLRKYDNPTMALRTIAKNLLRSHYRRQDAGIAPHADEDLAEPEAQADLSADSDAAEHFLHNEECRRIRLIVGQLRQDYARLIILRYYYGLPLREIAACLNQNYNTVAAWHRRALAALGHMLREDEER